MDPTTVSFEDFVSMSGAAKAMGLEKMCAHYAIDLANWTQISGGWTQAMGREMHKYASFGVMVEQEAARIQAGGAPRPLTSQAPAPGLAPTQIAPPGGYAPPGYAPAAAPPGYAPPAAPPAAPPGYAPPAAPPPGYAAPPAPAGQAPPPGYAPPAAPPAQPYAQPPQQQYPQQQQPYAQQPYGQQQGGQNFEQQASNAANAVGNAAMAGFDALGSAFDSFGKSINTPQIGSHVLVQWSDGNRYPATVTQIAQGQYCVAMQDGRQMWVQQQFVFKV